MLPGFVVHDARALLADFALYAPSRESGDVTLWRAVQVADPSLAFVVATAARRELLQAALATSDDDDVGIFLGDVADENGRRAVPMWIARAAHPGVSLARLRRQLGVAPLEVASAVARALTRRRLTPARIRDDAIVLGFDGVVTVDGFDNPGSPWWPPPFVAPPATDDERRALLRGVLTADELDAALAQSSDASSTTKARERQVVAGVARGLFPDEHRRVNAHNEQLALLDASAWAAWSTAGGSLLLAHPSSQGAHTLPFPPFVIDVGIDLLLLERARVHRSRHRVVSTRGAAVSLVVGTSAEIATFLATADDATATSRVAVVVGDGEHDHRVACIRVADVRHALAACARLATFVSPRRHDYFHGPDVFDLQQALSSTRIVEFGCVVGDSLASSVRSLLAALPDRLQTVWLRLRLPEPTTLHDINEAMGVVSDHLGADVDLLFSWAVHRCGPGASITFIAFCR
jgi:hypothetical protein